MITPYILTDLFLLINHFDMSYYPQFPGKEIQTWRDRVSDLQPKKNKQTKKRHTNHKEMIQILSYYKCSTFSNSHISICLWRIILKWKYYLFALRTYLIRSYVYVSTYGKINEVTFVIHIWMQGFGLIIHVFDIQFYS